MDDVAGAEVQRTRETIESNEAHHSGTQHDVVIDPVEEPSEEWGWTGQFPVLTRVLGWFMVLAILGLLFGNHEGRMADIWVVCVAAGLAAILIRDARRRRTSWRN